MIPPQERPIPGPAADDCTADVTTAPIRDDSPPYDAPTREQPELSWQLIVPSIVTVLVFGFFTWWSGPAQDLLLATYPQVVKHLGWWLAGGIVLPQLLFAGAGLLAARFQGITLSQMGLAGAGPFTKTDRRYVLYQVLGHFTFSAVVTVVAGLLQSSGETTTAMTVAEGLKDVPLGPMLTGALIAAILAGFCEEVFFRGYLIPALERGGLNPWLAAAITAALFGAIHLDGYGWMASLPKMLSFGLPMGLYFTRRRSLWPAIAAHTATDAFALVSLTLALTLLGK